MDQDVKYCYGCEDAYPLSAFNKNKRTKDGYQTQCRECIKEHRQRWAKENPKKRRARKLRSKYGLTTECYDKMMEAQNGRCAICGTTETRNAAYKFFPVDHCHETGKVRGLLCDFCNVGLGRFEDDIERLQKAIEYLKESK